MHPHTNQSSFHPLHHHTSFDSQSQSHVHTHLNSVQSMDASISSYQLDQFNPALHHVRPTKRPLVDPSRTSMSYPRKRAVTACQLCRTRKTKCSNARPKCKFCSDTGAECVYEDSLGHSSFDPASLLILDRLNQLLDRFDSATIPFSSAQVVPPSDNPTFHSSHHLQVNKENETAIEPSDEENVIRLVDNFIAFVHTKNPILDILTLKRYARSVAEDGPGWDGKTCLVLLTCALGSLAKPFSTSLYSSLLATMSTSSPSTDPNAPTSLNTSAYDLQLSAYYYSLARKRIGLLGSTIIRSQCYLLSGVYLMYALRPLEAWHDFVQASTTYYTYLQGRMRSAASHGDGVQVSRTRRLEQRLYWSCFKSECEIRVELSLPESTLAALQYPDLFPSPPVEETDPSPSPSTTAFDPSYSDFASPSSGGSQKRHTESMNESQQHSWYYYLTEIALRRIGNRILNALYKNGNVPGYGVPVMEMLEIAADFEKQLGQWQSNLPASVKYSHTNLLIIPSNELAFMVRGRTLEIQSWLYRPFLYYAIHHPSSDPFRPAMEPFVQKALVYGSAHIRGLGVRHRHHGTWYALRTGMAEALSLLAAVKSGVVDMGDGTGEYGGMGEGGWRETVKQMIEILGYWEAESVDVGRSKVVLEELLQDVEILQDGACGMD
ncbi:hypothetical protein BGZ61DRAFT_588540 [Ilyonectria robusta]|uniref:uncharacterized protein n=1 Tax=Ilyonectria robusta TaxID=1079257 RepID=UPI001E8CECAE|nr:uncharacterized protein BGZ61DRAFT_588540 [Ilyonectria robusta]KAH8694612.1 hypothetical protein BGZ61DRAFT_588540 [Ilyonectria robusta]